MTIISNFLFNFINFCVIISFLTRLLTSGTLFSTAVRTVVVVAKLLILGISALTSFILALRAVLVAKLAILGTLSSIFLILALHSVFLTTLFFITLFSLLKSNEVVSNFTISNLSTLLSKLLKLVAHLACDVVATSHLGLI